ncbi:MAG: DUF3352 domain-containing protein [Bacteroides sp.]|nr:DUF3352 domain-containing protein [Bacteroides sp.]
MRLRLIIRIAIIVSVVLLCTGFGVYSFLRLDAADRQRDFNLYELVPQDAVALVETDRMAELVSDIDELHCSKDNHFLPISELFVYLKKYFYTFVDDTPHGLSKQMNKMLLSFHEPDDALNQVLYCSLGADDPQLVEAFIQKYSSSTFPSRTFEYKGEDIHIYPMAGGRFLAAYFTSDFLAVSFQKRLIEQVIDAYRSDRSLMQLPSFRAMHTEKRTNVSATVYVRMKSVDMGKGSDSLQTTALLGNWAEFDLKLSGEGIYCSGISHEADSMLTFINILGKQRPVEEFPGKQLPASTFFYDCLSISDKEAMFGFTASQEYAKSSYSDYIKDRDKEWIDFVSELGGEQAISCLFQSKDTTDKHPCAVLSLPLKDAAQAEKKLQSLLYTTPKEKDAPPLPKLSPEYARYPKARWYRQYILPRNTLLTQLSGVAESSLYSYACFYKGAMLLASDARSLSAYIDAMERGEVLEGVSAYEEVVSSLSQSYRFVMMADLGEVFRQPEAYVRLVPNFFFRQADFFRHFMLSIQFTCSEGVVYPNIVLLYKGDPKLVD